MAVVTNTLISSSLWSCCVSKSKCSINLSSTDLIFSAGNPLGHSTARCIQVGCGLTKPAEVLGKREKVW